MCLLARLSSFWAVGSHVGIITFLQAKKAQTVVEAPADSDFATDSGK